MNTILKLSLLLLAVGVCGCESKTSPPTGVIPAAQTQALKDAKNIEGKLLEHDEQARKQLED